MAIGTFEELKTALANWSGRSSLTDRLPEFITLAEQRIKNGSSFSGVNVQALRTRHMLTSGSIGSTVAGADTVALPSGFIEFFGQAYINTLPKTPLNNVALSYLRSTYLGSDSGRPKAFSVLGSNVILGPTPDAVYEVNGEYYTLPGLVAGADAGSTFNEVLLNHPDVYLYASLVEMYIFLRAMDRAAEYFAAYASAVKSAMEADSSAKYSGGAVVMRSPIGAP